ncbi:MAG: hypothetical protein AABY15_07295 [Nanoarchaeota archaeon]
MFGFLKEEAEELGSVGRFYKRIEKFRKRNIREKTAWAVYREESSSYPERLKSWNKQKLSKLKPANLREPRKPSRPNVPKFRIIPPVIEHHFWWLLHNCIAHMLIGIIPVKWFFTFHDWTSRKLNAEY